MIHVEPAALDGARCSLRVTAVPEPLRSRADGHAWHAPDTRLHDPLTRHAGTTN